MGREREREREGAKTDLVFNTLGDFFQEILDTYQNYWNIILHFNDLHMSQSIEVWYSGFCNGIICPGWNKKIWEYSTAHNILLPSLSLLDVKFHLKSSLAPSFLWLCIFFVCCILQVIFCCPPILQFGHFLLSLIWPEMFTWGKLFHCSINYAWIRCPKLKCVTESWAWKIGQTRLNNVQW